MLLQTSLPQILKHIQVLIHVKASLLCKKILFKYQNEYLKKHEGFRIKVLLSSHVKVFLSNKNQTHVKKVGLISSHSFWHLLVNLKNKH